MPQKMFLTKEFFVIYKLLGLSKNYFLRTQDRAKSCVKANKYFWTDETQKEKKSDINAIYSKFKKIISILPKQHMSF